MDDAFKQEARRYADQVIDTRLGSIEFEMSRFRGAMESFTEVIERLVRVEERGLALAEQEKSNRDVILKIDERVRIMETSSSIANNEVDGLVKLRSSFYMAIVGACAMFLVSKFTG